MMDLVFGVDGGRTSVKCVLATTDGRILGQGAGGPLIHLAALGGRERLAQSLREALTATWEAASLSPQPVKAIGLGLAGVEAETDEARQVLELLPSLVTAQQIDVQSDAVAALIGAHMGKPGIIVIAGTGSIVLGIDHQGKQARAGGWGWLVGDEGSALAIGRSGLLAAFYSFDGVSQATLLEKLVLEHFGTPSIPDIKRLVYADGFGQRGFASLAPLVSRAAQQGDEVAARIIGEAGRALANQVTAVVRRLSYETAPVAPAGGAFTHIDGLRTAFEAALRAAPERTRVVSPGLPPVLGAVIMAVNKCGANLEQVVPRLAAESQAR